MQDTIRYMYWFHLYKYRIVEYVGFWKHWSPVFLCCIYQPTWIMTEAWNLYMAPNSQCSTYYFLEFLQLCKCTSRNSCDWYTPENCWQIGFSPFRGGSCVLKILLYYNFSPIILLSKNVQRHKVGVVDNKIYMLVYAEALRDMLFCSVSAFDACKIHHF